LNHAHSSLRRIGQVGGFLVYTLVPIVPALLSGSLPPLVDRYELSRVVGIFAFVYLANQLLLAARLRFLDRLFGHDRLLRFHGAMAAVGVLLGVAHRILKDPFLYPGEQLVHRLIGLVALVLFAAVVFVTATLMAATGATRSPAIRRVRSTLRERFGVQYQHLRAVHNGTVVLLAILAVHVLTASSMAVYPAAFAFVVADVLVAVGVYIAHRFVRSAVAARRPWRVVAAEASGEVTTIRLAPPSVEGRPRAAGQFCYFRFLDGFPGSEEHPFTVASAPSEREIAFCAKAVGDFTAALSRVVPGAPVAVTGPYGVFTLDRAPSDAPLVFVAGGIGITPFLSMASQGIASQGAVPGAATQSKATDAPVPGAATQSRATDAPVPGAATRGRARRLILLWSVKEVRDLLGLETLRAGLPTLGDATLRVFVTAGETSIPDDAVARRVSAADIAVAVAEAAEGGVERVHAYVCGPSEFADWTTGELSKHRVRGSRIHRERFAT
jgi:predicted ferric reductase